MRRAILLIILILTMVTGTALTDSLNGRFGFTGKGVALAALQDDFISTRSGSKAGPAAGAGLICGLGKNFVAEIDVNHVPEQDVEMPGSKVFEASLADKALGMQDRLVPFFAAGIDFMKGTFKAVAGAGYDLDWSVGGHASAGVDYFITSGIALTAEPRRLLAAKGDIGSAGIRVGEYEPRSFIGTLGIRLILPQSLVR